MGDWPEDWNTFFWQVDHRKRHKSRTQFVPDVWLQVPPMCLVEGHTCQKRHLNSWFHIGSRNARRLCEERLSDYTVLLTGSAASHTLRKNVMAPSTTRCSNALTWLKHRKKWRDVTPAAQLLPSCKAQHNSSSDTLQEGRKCSYKHIFFHKLQICLLLRYI